MVQLSDFFNNQFGKLHYTYPETIDSTKPTILFLHGASPRSQHTEYWEPILHVLEKHCNPILLDRFGHGKSQLTQDKIGLQDHLQSLKSFINSVMPKYMGSAFAMIGRSAGAGYTLQLFKQVDVQVAGIGLIAPGSLKTNGKYLTDITIPCFLFWDIEDPIVKFGNYEIIVQSGINHKLYIIGDADISNAITTSHEGIKKSHVPEILAPEFFNEFLTSFCASL